MISANKIKAALDKCSEVSARFHNYPPFPSIAAQLSYLLDLSEGRTKDRSRLAEIILGVQAAREIEQLDNEFAEILHDISSEVRAINGSNT